MAEYQADGRYQPVETASFGKIVTWVGGILSVAMVAGVVFWGYKMVMRDVSGVPVVRAMAGDVRRMPEDAGGQTADFQGLAVNRVAAGEGADGAADRVSLAPEPQRLGQEGMTERELAVALRIKQDAAPTGGADLGRDDSAALASLVIEGAENTPRNAPLTEDYVDAAPEELVEAALPESDGAGTPTAVAAIGAYSVRPRMRPTDLAEVRAAAIASPPAPVQSFVASADVPMGTQLAQLGSFGSEEIAQQEWTRLSRKFDIYLDGKQRVIQRAEVGGRIYYRLRAMGFASLGDTERFCAALVASNADCIAVVTR
ncbi:SPOR domain-containing protein [Pseudooceanicola algae]|uniref:Uncharacterized protein n=1 Tax=Pseudooceanicola algae TaxID=1537215 RepID=A0A418SDN1_9RHOB|nr:SPOR domain-containing protein [Pseudooceanicola algae]QPM89454.1 hypothetical protein PSAL_006730 [Pseudooceanicola algae]